MFATARPAIEDIASGHVSLETQYHFLDDHVKPVHTAVATIPEVAESPQTHPSRSKHVGWKQCWWSAYRRILGTRSPAAHESVLARAIVHIASSISKAALQTKRLAARLVNKLRTVAWG